MRKRVMLATALAMGLCLAPVSYAVESGSEIELGSMSTVDLLNLRNAITEELSQRNEVDIISEGAYEVGVDIREANFKLTGVTKWGTVAYVYEDKESYKATDGSKRTRYMSEPIDDDSDLTTEPIYLNLKNGEVVVISIGPAIIEEEKPSWAPDNSEAE